MHFDLTDQYWHRASAIHQLDPRAKVMATLLFILTASLTPQGSWPAFGALLALILVAAWASRLGPIFAIRRSIIALPFVLAAAALPFTTPGPTAFIVPGVGWKVSVSGLVLFLTVLTRTWLAVQAAILLTATTRFSDLLWGLAAIGVPRALVGTIGSMYRYLFVLADEALRMLRARSARSAAPRGSRKPSLWWQGRVTGSMVGSLFLRALKRSEGVYAAMVSRGYDGQMRTLRPTAMRAMDWFVLASLIILLAAILVHSWAG